MMNNEEREVNKDDVTTELLMSLINYNSEYFWLYKYLPNNRNSTLIISALIS